MTRPASLVATAVGMVSITRSARAIGSTSVRSTPCATVVSFEDVAVVERQSVVVIICRRDGCDH